MARAGAVTAWGDGIHIGASAASDCGDDPWVPAADVAFTDQDLLCFLREEDVEGSHDSWLQLAGPFSGSAPTAASSARELFHPRAARVETGIGASLTRMTKVR